MTVEAWLRGLDLQSSARGRDVRVKIADFIGEFCDPAEERAREGDVVLGHRYPTMDAPAFGRAVALVAGLRVDVPGLQQ